MGVNVFWVNDDKTIVQYDFIGRWTWEDFYPAYEEALRMEASVTHRVDVIINLLESRSIPPNALSHLKNITDKQPDNIGVSVLVTTHRFVKVMYDMGVKFYPKMRQYFAIVETMDEAFETIASVRAALNPSD